VTKQELGGAMTHNERAALHISFPATDADGCAMIRELLGFLPSNNWKIRRGATQTIR